MSKTPSASAGAIHTSIDGSTGWLVIDNEAKRNALTLAMWKDLPGAVQNLADDSQVRVIVVRGAGSTSFVAGADISEFKETRSTAERAQAYDAINVAAFKALKTATKPTLAMIDGHCLGGGLGIALACDLRIATKGSVFGIPAARLGIAYPLEAMSDIIQSVGPMNAKRLLFTAERIGTGEALRLGIIGEEVNEKTELEERVSSLCASLAANAPLTQRAAKRAINAIASGSRPDDMCGAVDAANACFGSKDFEEGRNAFLEKRAPTFCGK
ncbi:enoyl-CoA hydratase [Roseibium sp.]|uniref:enoyl-CoA hydratase n=1 Tax=Roseibium sp. TaxID=1936156 RepID=UPI003A97FB10